MSLFSEAKNQMGFAKIGIYGLSGSGKTTTAMKFATGLATMGDEVRPIYFVDTETGSDWFVQRMKEQGIPFFVTKTNAFINLSTAIDEAEKAGAVLIIDSISHFWDEIKTSYMARKKKRFIRMTDWPEIKGLWREMYALKFINAKCHIIVCGRVQDIYETVTEEGSPEFIRTGDRMRAEKDFSHEPSLVLKMEGIPATLKELEKAKTKKERQGISVNSDILIRATVVKDRSDVMNGRVIEFPTYKDFVPHFKAINIGGEHLGIDTSNTSEPLFGDNSALAASLRIKREIALEEIKAEISRAIPGRDTNSNNMKSDILKGMFKTRSWTAVTELPLVTIEYGIMALPTILENMESVDDVVELASSVMQDVADQANDLPVSLPQDLLDKYKDAEMDMDKETGRVTDE